MSEMKENHPTYLHVIWKVYFGVVKRERNITNVNGSLWGEMGLVWLGGVRGPKARREARS